MGPAACSAKGLEVAKTNKEAIEEKERKKDQVEQWRRNKEKLGEEEWLNTMKVKEKKIFWENSKESNFELHKTDITIVSYDIVNNVANL